MSSLSFEAVDKFLFGSSEYIIDAMYLIEFVLAWEERLLGDEFEENASESPDVHLFVIVAVSHEALGSSIPPGGDIVRVG